MEEAGAESVGKHIRLLRRNAGLTLVRLSELSGVDQGNLSRIESGKTRPNASTLGKITRALELKLGSLDGFPANTIDVEPRIAGEHPAKGMFTRVLDTPSETTNGDGAIATYRAERPWHRFGIRPGDVLLVEIGGEPQSDQLMLVEAADLVVPYQVHILKWADQKKSKPSYFEVHPLIGEMPKDRTVIAAGPVFELRRCMHRFYT